tara:strand:- start:301 stop:1215 length:915 start_codon:yes stop_codon:yes gene_type:complete
MLYLDPKSVKSKVARKKHLDRLIDLIYKRIDNIDCLFVKSFFDFYVNDHLDVLLSGEITEIYKLSEQLNHHLCLKPNLLKFVNYVFKYDWFIDKVQSRYCGYDLAKNLDVSTCTYCNRNFTNTVVSRKGLKLTRPQFDHYFDKSTHPFLALSFYNLIPCCSICNTSIKHGQEFNLNSHAHPYLDKIAEEFSFSYEYSLDPYHRNGLKIKTNVYKDRFVKKYLEDLKIEDVYNPHTDILFDLIKIKQSYSDKYLSILEKEVLKGLKVSKSELYRLAFGVSIEESDFGKRPFSKFKKDILKELNII